MVADPTSGKGALVSTVRCLDCAYELTGQPAAGLCPECGASIVESRRVAHALATVGVPRLHRLCLAVVPLSAGWVLLIALFLVGVSTNFAFLGESRVEAIASVASIIHGSGLMLASMVVIVGLSDEGRGIAAAALGLATTVLGVTGLIFLAALLGAEGAQGMASESVAITLIAARAIVVASIAARLAVGIRRPYPDFVRSRATLWLASILTAAMWSGFGLIALCYWPLQFVPQWVMPIAAIACVSCDAALQVAMGVIAVTLIRARATHWPPAAVRAP